MQNIARTAPLASQAVRASLPALSVPAASAAGFASGKVTTHIYVIPIWWFRGLNVLFAFVDTH